jgi:hypothetical protein
MSASLHRVPQSDPLDVKRTPLSIRSLNYKRPAIDVVSRVRGEFIEMRGFSPTIEQAARLFDLSRDECDSVLNGLIQQGFLHRTSDGRYRLTP